MKRQGYLWNYFGFTRLHLWGVHIVSAAFAGVGTFIFCFAILGMLDDAPSSKTLVLLKCSGIAFLGCIATVAASILALLFFLGGPSHGITRSEVQ